MLCIGCRYRAAWLCCSCSYNRVIQLKWFKKTKIYMGKIYICLLNICGSISLQEFETHCDAVYTKSITIYCIKGKYIIQNNRSLVNNNFHHWLQKIHLVEHPSLNRSIQVSCFKELWFFLRESVEFLFFSWKCSCEPQSVSSGIISIAPESQP